MLRGQRGRFEDAVPLAWVMEEGTTVRESRQPLDAGKGK